MKHILFSFFGIFLLCSVATVAEARDFPWAVMQDSQYYGDHPWDVRTEEDRARRWLDKYFDVQYRFPKEYFYTHPDYAKRRALNPVTRSLYYTPPQTDDPYLQRFIGRSEYNDYHYNYRYEPEVGRNTPHCYNYTYSRSNRFVAPFGHQCY